MSISAKDVAELRRQTGAGMMDCKKALQESDGDLQKATEWLQKKSLAAVGKRAGKVAAEGAVGSYVHSGRIGVLVEINSETDFVARNEEFQQLVRDVAMHIAASNPQYVRDEEVSAVEIEKNREIFLEQMRGQGKPEAMLAKIVEGKIAKWKKEICLVDQPFVKNPEVTVGQYVDDVASRIREKITIRRFVRFEVGEGIEKQTDDFAAEVAAAAQG